MTIVMLSVVYVECHIRALNAEYHLTECCNTECRGAVMLSVPTFIVMLGAVV
jgi:hypothetical protein